MKQKIVLISTKTKLSSAQLSLFTVAAAFVGDLTRDAIIRPVYTIFSHSSEVILNFLLFLQKVSNFVINFTVGIVFSVGDLTFKVEL